MLEWVSNIYHPFYVLDLDDCLDDEFDNPLELTTLPFVLGEPVATERYSVTELRDLGLCGMYVLRTTPV